MTTESGHRPNAVRLERTYEAPAETWTQGYRDHRGNELDNLDAAIRRRTT